MALLCLKIFFARLLDVTLGTFRTIILVKGKTLIAAFLAFAEILIWFLVAKEALVNTNNNFIIPIFYALGYTTGTVIGSLLSKKYIKGIINVQIITSKATKKNLEFLREEGYALTVVDATEPLNNTPQKIIYIETNNQELKNLITAIKKIDKSAFITASETKYVENGFIK